ncbi:hypothetical protein G5B88_04620 [Herbaspirillum seropedicae]|nr:hypothetical protein ACP92_04580 [Herbaspirillum seropedicae]UMU24123.1 hypothetical protein G5B88_04620 [Herbaspirillum seropedicae]
MHGKVSPVAALTLNFFYKSYDVTIVGYQLNEGWRMALELRNGSSAEVIRDTSTIYPDFNSLRSMAIWLAHQKIREKEERPSPENGNS